MSADLRAASDRLDLLLRELDAHTDPAVRDRAHEAVGLLMELHREGLSAALALAADSTLGGPALINRLADDPLIGALLSLHGVHPYSVAVRLTRALDRLRSRIAAQGCRAALAGVDGPVARVRLEGAVRLSPRSELVETIETALLDAAPELSSIVIDTMATGTAETAPLLQILRHPPAPGTVAAGVER